MNAKTAPATPAATQDEFHGMGGSYTLDPVTGERTRTAFTAQAEPRTLEEAGHGAADAAAADDASATDAAAE